MFEDTGLYSQMRILVVSQKSCTTLVYYYVSYKYTDIPQYDVIEARIRTEGLRLQGDTNSVLNRIRTRSQMSTFSADARDVAQR